MGMMRGTWHSQRVEEPVHDMDHAISQRDIRKRDLDAMREDHRFVSNVVQSLHR